MAHIDRHVGIGRGPASADAVAAADGAAASHGTGRCGVAVRLAAQVMAAAQRRPRWRRDAGISMPRRCATVGTAACSAEDQRQHRADD